MPSFKSCLNRFDSNLWQYHFLVPDTIVEKLISNDNKRIICTIEQISWPAALLKSQNYWFVLVNNENRNKLGLTEGDEIQVSLVQDLSEYGFEIPEELRVLFEQDEEAHQYFVGMSLGKRRSLIYLVQKVKNSNSRLKKSLAIAHHLKDMKGKLDFKLLNETIKAFNKKSI